jgi:hypothetical protein
MMNHRSSSTRAADVSASARVLDPVSPDDAGDLPGGVARALFVGDAGVLQVADTRGVVVELVSGASQYHPIEVRRVLATGTTAGRILALY